MAKASRLSRRFVQFVACDQSRTKFMEHWRWQPASIRFDPGYYHVTQGHSTYVIGRCYALTRHPKEPARGSVTLPNFIEGECVIGYAVHYGSPLADVAWRGLQHGIFSHACAVVAQQPDDPDGVGDLKELALVSEVEAGCPGARFLKMWG
jgi:hypothetical protein